jgi:preprotein translocase subunit SecE
MNKLTAYIKSSAEEMKKVTWPTKNEVRSHTLLVIGVSLAVAIFIGFLDYFFNLGVELIINK